MPKPTAWNRDGIQMQNQFLVKELAVEEFYTYSNQFDAKIWTSFKMEEKDGKCQGKK